MNLRLADRQPVKTGAANSSCSSSAVKGRRDRLPLGRFVTGTRMFSAGFRSMYPCSDKHQRKNACAGTKISATVLSLMRWAALAVCLSANVCRTATPLFLRSRAIASR